MRSVLGIDAAWSTTQPSGVALVVEHDAGWSCGAVAPSYEEFIAIAEGTAVKWGEKTRRGSVPDVQGLLEAAESLAGAPVDLVAVDMPLARSAFETRRPADNEVSKEFGARLCATHSPTATRPGQLGRELTQQLADAGLSLATSSMLSPQRSFIEVYPHPALLSLLPSEKRVRYKVSKTRKYWPAEDAPTRIRKLLTELSAIHDALEISLGSLGFDLPTATSHFSSLKRYEDALDALVCAWAGTEHLLGRTTPLGNHDAAIWCPTDVIRGRIPDKAMS
ncbi:DUF429 domain-containing protein [Lysobacter koreensis]|uniref:DUF429 domain-containing protein n=1 Tax=Lysobacter koreensis TaxID=266122 RepID=A0ABW2YKK4_9GAMM